MVVWYVCPGRGWSVTIHTCLYQGCSCIPDFLVSLVTPEMLPALSRMVKVSTEAMETIKVGKRKCKCKFNMEVDGSSCLKSKGACDKKCNGQANQVEIMKGMYLLDISVKRGKVMINKCEVTEPGIFDQLLKT